MCRTAKSTFPLAFTPARTQDKAKSLLLIGRFSPPIRCYALASQVGLQTTSIYISLVMQMYMYTHVFDMYICVHMCIHIAPALFSVVKRYVCV